MFTVFRGFFSSGPISGGLYVSVSSGFALAQDGVSPLIFPSVSGGFTIGTVEPYQGNTNSPVIGGTVNSSLPVTVRLFGPTRNVALTGLATTGLSAGSLIYLGTSGMGAITGSVLIGVTLEFASTNGAQVEVADINA